VIIFKRDKHDNTVPSPSKHFSDYHWPLVYPTALKTDGLNLNIFEVFRKKRVHLHVIK